MQRILRAKRFKFLVTLVLLVTFFNLGLPLNVFAAVAVDAAQQRSLNGGGGESPGLFAVILDSITSFVSNMGKSLANIGKSIKETFASIGKSKDDPQIPEKTLNSKTTKLGGGKYHTEIYSEPINFKNKNGDIEAIDNTLVKSNKDNFGFENKANSFNVFFAENTISNNLVRVVSDKHTVEWRLLDANNTSGHKKGNSISYNGVFNGVDLKYSVQNTKVKEELVLQNPNVPTTYRFELNLKNLYYVQEQDGSISFYDQVTKEKLWSFEKPFICDAAGQECENVSLGIKNTKGHTYLELSANKDWLKAKGRKFPAVLDPTVVYQPNAEVGRDTFVSSRYPNSNYYARSYIKAGYDSTHRTTKSLIYFSDIASIPSNARVTSASIGVYQYYGGSGGYVNLHEAYNPWVSGSVTWNSMPGYGGNI